MPAAHAVHGPPTGPPNPALHVQAVSPAVERECAPQDTHGPPLRLVYPALQTQESVLMLVCPGELELALHTQAALLVLCTGEVAADRHATHTDDPVALLNVPAAHGAHATPSEPVEPALHVQSTRAPLAAGACEPVGHNVHAEAAVVEYLPATQSLHAVPPGAALYVPEPQVVHARAPTRLLYVPGRHNVHAEAAVMEYLPAIQSLHAVPPDAALYVPGSQVVHARAPTRLLYVPAAHVTHASPLEPADPVLHVQLTRAPLASGACEPVGHDLHTSDVAPVAVEYVPAEQSLHVAPAGATLYLPAMHVTQTGGPSALL